MSEVKIISGKQILMSLMKKILFVQTTINPPGGKSSVAAWIVEALKDEYEVSLLTWEPPDLEEINRFYGTSLKSSELTVYRINPAVRAVINLDPDPGSFQKTSYLMRICKKINKDYDVVVSADDEIEFGCRGIQYIHYPFLHKKIWPGVDSNWHNKLKGLFKRKYRPWMLLSGFSYNEMKENLTLVNSDWTGNEVKEFYGIETKTVYPPVQGGFAEIPWEEKENGFVCIGRLSPEKRIEAVIEILSLVRSKATDVHLHIIGTAGEEKKEREYYQKLTGLVQKNSSWIFLHENLSREELIQLATMHRYGIHAFKHEHFGIAVAEMVKAGCIVFVPNDGGQVEIVGGDKRLTYETEKQAINKIIQVIKNPEEQISIRNYLDSRKGLFSTEKFMNSIREIVEQF